MERHRAVIKPRPERQKGPAFMIQSELIIKQPYTSTRRSLLSALANYREIAVSGWFGSKVWALCPDPLIKHINTLSCTHTIQLISLSYKVFKLFFFLLQFHFLVWIDEWIHLNEDAGRLFQRWQLQLQQSHRVRSEWNTFISVLEKVSEQVVNELHWFDLWLYHGEYHTGFCP